MVPVVHTPVVFLGPAPRLAIIGAGALGQQVAQHAHQSRSFTVVGFFDDTQPAGHRTPGGVVLGPLSAIGDSFAAGAFDELLLSIGYHHLQARQRIFEELAGRIPFARFVHPMAYVDPSVRLGMGTFVSPGCVLDLNCVLEDNVFLYPGCVLAHETVVGAHSLFGPGVRIAGQVRIGQRCFLGVGTTLIDSLTIVDDVITGGGAVVTRSLTAPGVYAGIPARQLRPALTGGADPQ